MVDSPSGEQHTTKGFNGELQDQKVLDYQHQIQLPGSTSSNGASCQIHLLEARNIQVTITTTKSKATCTCFERSSKLLKLAWLLWMV